jgi:hypothetical protein
VCGIYYTNSIPDQTEVYLIVLIAILLFEDWILNSSWCSYQADVI